MNRQMKVLTFISVLFIVHKSSAQLTGCSPNPCKNGATCYDQPDTLYGYSCICTAGYSGINCQKRDYNDDIGRINSGSGGDVGNNLNRNDKNGPKLPERQDISNRKFPSSSGIFDSNSNFPGSANRGKNEIPASGGINPCFNGGTFVKNGLPCYCPAGFVGNRCETQINSNLNPFSNLNLCSSFPCRNNGRCLQPVGSPGFTCECMPPYYGQRCEFSKSHYSNRVKYYSIGSLLPFLCCMCMLISCLYFCCFKKHSIGNNGFITRTQSFFGGNAGPRWNGPMGPVPPNPPNMIYRGPPPNQGFNMMQTRAPIPMQDPDEAFKVYNSPPPYEETVKFQRPPNAF